MIGTLAYMIALGAPEIASATAEASGRVVEVAGRRFAAGVIDESTSRLKATHGSLLESAMGALIGGAGRSLGDIQDGIVRSFRAAVSGAGSALVTEEELALLREVAVAAAGGGGSAAAAVENLKAFYRRQAKEAAVATTKD